MRNSCLLLILVLTLSIAGSAQSDSLKTVSADSIPLSPIKKLRMDSDTIAFIHAFTVDTGIASWYGNKWNGRLTASGELFHPYNLTAAHKSLPFGTLVKVTNLKNDSVVIVRIIDRLPQKSARSIDLTPKAAKQLNFYSDGLVTVTMEVIGITPVNKYVRKKKKTPVKK